LLAPVIFQLNSINVLEIILIYCSRLKTEKNENCLKINHFKKWQKPEIKGLVLNIEINYAFC
jgi:hypothetical protein